MQRLFVWCKLPVVSVKEREREREREREVEKERLAERERKTNFFFLLTARNYKRRFGCGEEDRKSARIKRRLES